MVSTCYYLVTLTVMISLIFMVSLVTLLLAVFIGLPTSNLCMVAVLAMMITMILAITSLCSRFLGLLHFCCPHHVESPDDDCPDRNVCHGLPYDFTTQQNLLLWDTCFAHALTLSCTLSLSEQLAASEAPFASPPFSSRHHHA
ncbi:hypothetical protein BDB00DRAFT_795270 [Zychaea mexicana]|uniref:uncharacterized protein n=1 Tax=Zychaea mexicana TaxID=64656 RepID=UPI0022FE81E7|nr:uncharacterized protein BDB00DRAFT_795270 [Zychaea mexicana]KAI9499720.1 hypothetical protein BDB00DRAFT_795270 [Zychaea mexicana]